jgi:molybdopterin-binding protein
MRLSARNQIPATVTAITAGEATANIELDAGGVRLVASITVEAARELGLAKGSPVTAVIKASDVIVAVLLSPGGGDPPYPPMSTRPSLTAKSAIVSGPPARTKAADRDFLKAAKREFPQKLRTETCLAAALRGRPLSLSHCDYLPIGHGHWPLPARGNLRLAAMG